MCQTVKIERHDSGNDVGAGSCQTPLRSGGVTARCGPGLTIKPNRLITDNRSIRALVFCHPEDSSYGKMRESKHEALWKSRVL